jgi:hypothetical protein
MNSHRIGKNYGTLDMSVEAQVERVRMCVAELGYNPRLIQLDIRDDDDCIMTIRDNFTWPHRVTWRARELALVTKPICCRCSELQLGRELTCEATVRLVEDCGTDRPTMKGSKV